MMEDIYRATVDRQASDAALLRMGQTATLLVGVVAAVCACLFSDIVKILSFVYDFWAPTMVFPFLVGIFWLGTAEKEFSSNQSINRSGFM